MKKKLSFMKYVLLLGTISLVLFFNQKTLLADCVDKKPVIEITSHSNSHSEDPIVVDSNVVTIEGVARDNGVCIRELQWTLEDNGSIIDSGTPESLLKWDNEKIYFTWFAKEVNLNQGHNDFKISAGDGRGNDSTIVLPFDYRPRPASYIDIDKYKLTYTTVDDTDLCSFSGFFNDDPGNPIMPRIFSEPVTITLQQELSDSQGQYVTIFSYTFKPDTVRKNKNKYVVKRRFPEVRFNNFYIQKSKGDKFKIYSYFTKFYWQHFNLQKVDLSEEGYKKYVRSFDSSIVRDLPKNKLPRKWINNNIPFGQCI